MSNECNKDATEPFAEARCSAAVEPLMPYESWKALGPERAAEYLSRRRGYDAQRQGKLWAILESAWGEPPKP